MNFLPRESSPRDALMVLLVCMMLLFANGCTHVLEGMLEDGLGPSGTRRLRMPVNPIFEDELRRKGIPFWRNYRDGYYEVDKDKFDNKWDYDREQERNELIRLYEEEKRREELKNQTP